MIKIYNLYGCPFCVNKKKLVKDVANTKNSNIFMRSQALVTFNVFQSPCYGKTGRTVSYMSYISAYMLESALFYGHLHGRPILDMQVSVYIN